MLSFVEQNLISNMRRMSTTSEASADADVDAVVFGAQRMRAAKRKLSIFNPKFIVWARGTARYGTPDIFVDYFNLSHELVSLT